MKKPLVLALAACALAAPAALAVKPAGTPVAPVKPTKPVPVVSYLFKGKVMSADQQAGTMTVSPVMGTNLFGRRAFYGATAPYTIVVKIAATTKLRSRVIGPNGSKSFVPQSFSELREHDVVFFHIRAKKGLKAADLVDKPALWVRDLTPAPPAPAPTA
jgi:hypothetical protein